MIGAPSTSAVLALLTAAVLLMGSPGPATMSLAAFGAALGVRRVLAFLTGIIAGTTAVLLIVATGVTGLFLSVPGIGPAIVALAGGYILFLAWKIATAKPTAIGGQGNRAPTILGGLFLALANPKAYAAIGAVYSSATLVAGRPLADAGAKVALLTGVIVAVNATWLVFGAALAGLLQHERLGRIANLVFAVLLVAAFVASVFL